MAYTGSEEDKKTQKTLTKLTGGDIGDKLVQGAYMAAAANTPDYSWMSVVGSGVKAYKTAYDTRKNLEQTKRDGYFGEIKSYVDKIYEMDGSLDKTYFDQAYDYTEQLREEYVAAQQSGDNKKALQIKGKLNAFSTSIQTVKTDVTEAAGMWKDGMLIDERGMSDEQISINKSITNAKNAVLNTEDGVFKWRNVDYKPGGKGYLGKEFFTPEDIKDSIPMRDDITTEELKKANVSVLDNGEAYRNGTSKKGFDYKIQNDANIKLINASVKEVGSLQSVIWDDMTGQGSFVDSLDQHPNFKNIFDTLNTGGTPGTNLAVIGMYDKNGDKTVDFRDFLDPNNIEHQGYMEEINTIAMSDGKAGISEVEMEKILSDESLFNSISVIAKDKLKEALTRVEHDNFDEDVSKKLIADFFTSRQSQMFYGDDSKYKDKVPKEGGGDGSIIWSDKYKRLYIDKVHKNNRVTDLNHYLELGGNYGYLKEMGWVWDDSEKKFNYIKPSSWNPGEKKYDKIK